MMSETLFDLIPGVAPPASPRWGRAQAAAPGAGGRAGAGPFAFGARVVDGRGVGTPRAGAPQRGDPTMARLVLTNASPAFAGVLAGWEAAGLRRGLRRTDGPLRVATAPKRAVAHVNAVAPAPDRWIVGTGTCVTFSGKLGEAALREVLEALDPRDPLAVRGRVFGHYAIAARLGDRVVAFCDAIASYELYHWTSPCGDAFVVSNFLSDFLAFEGVPRVADDLGALKAAYHGERGIARTSLLPGVLSVGGNEMLEIALRPGAAALSVRSAPPPRPSARPEGFEEGVRSYVRRSDRVFEALSALPSVAINATGGLDSRLLLASAHRHGLRPTLLYGAGNSAMTNTRPEDLAIARALAEAYGWPLRVMDWRQDRPHGAEGRRRLHLRHGFKQPYGATEGLMRALEGGIEPYPELQMGGYNPAFTNRKPWSWGTGRIAMGDFLRRYAADYAEVLASPEARDAYFRGLEADMRALAAELGIAVEADGLRREDFVRLLIQARASKEAFNLNAFNQFGFYLAPYFTAELYADLLAVPGDWREGDRFQLHAIRANCERALELPIFSGVKRFRLDAAAMTMSPVAPGLAARLGRRLGAAAAEVAGALPGGLARPLGRLAGPGGPGADATAAFREGLRAALEREHPSAHIDPRLFARKDLRAVHRYLVARELAGPQA